MCRKDKKGKGGVSIGRTLCCWTYGVHGGKLVHAGYEGCVRAKDKAQNGPNSCTCMPAHACCDHAHMLVCNLVRLACLLCGP